MNASARRIAVAACALAGLVAGSGELYARSSSNVLNLANPAIDTTSNLALSYSSNSTIQASGTVTVNNGTKSANNGSYCVTFTLTNPGQQGNMSFSLINVSNGNVLSLTGSPGSSSQVLSGSFASGTPANTNQTFTIGFQVNPASMPAPGICTANITENLYGGSTFPASGPILDYNTLTVTISVGSFYDVSIVPSGSAFNLSSTSQALNFGSLVEGKQVGADILVRSNVSYSLSLSSMNRGVLANSSDPASSVAYSLSSNHSAINLDPGPGLVASVAPATYGNPSRCALLATILPLSSSPSAGAYADTITVNLSSP
jgi:hypothetical protein